jgi:drug/metabolite transporter (DMT)-like permease
MTLLVLMRILLSVSANGLQKRLLLDGLRVTPVWLATYMLMLVPGLIFAVPCSLTVSAGFWVNVLLGGLLDAAGNLAMVAALSSTDLSIFGPLNAFRPMLALCFGWIFLGETPTLAGAAGVAVIIGGALTLLGGETPTAPSAENNQSQPKPRMNSAALRVLSFRLLGLSLSTIGAVFLKRAALAGPIGLTLGGWIACGLLCLFVVTFARCRHPLALISEALRRHPAWLIAHTFTFFAMQWLTIRIFQQTLLAYSFAYFQLAMVLQVLCGRLFFREPHLRRRLAGAVVMCLGSALLAWRG